MSYTSTCPITYFIKKKPQKYKKIPPKMTVFNRLIFNPYVDCDMCPVSPNPGLLGWRAWVCWWALCSLLLNLGWCCIISLACKLFFPLLYVCKQFICTFLSLQTIFLRIFHPPPPKKCKLPEEYDNMILCDLCGQWFHFRCVEYATSLSTSNEWLCRLCTPPAAKKPKMCM
jgi:hypothetical protein